MENTRIYGVTVNHNTSHFVELMLRTLLLTNDLAAQDFVMTVLDNGSNDEKRSDLAAYLSQQRIAFEQTGFDTSIAGEKHGSAFQTFIDQHADCTHYLFLDADMWFIEPYTLTTMVQELAAAGPNVFANQARIAGYYAGRVIEGRDGIAGAADERAPWTSTVNQRSYQTRNATRCSPVCSLIANTPLFRAVVQQFGLSAALRLGINEAIFYDTFALMTNIMTSHAQRFIVSSKTVHHFTETSYATERRAPKDRDCLLMLGDLRGGRDMTRSLFFESDWVRQQRDAERRAEQE